MKRWTWLSAAAAATGVAATAWIACRPAVIDVAHPAELSLSQSVVASGQVMPAAEIRLLSLVSSTATEVPFREGDRVLQGQVLLKLDDTEARAALRRAAAELDAARAGRAELLSLSGPAAASQMRRAAAQLMEAKKRTQEDEQLNASGIVPDAMLDSSRTALTVAEASYQAATLQMRAASQDGSQSLSVAAGIAQTEAQLAITRDRLARHTVRAPVDGVLLRRTVEPGDAVLNGAPLFVLSSLGATRIRIEPDERNLALLALGQPAIVSSEAFSEQSFAATVQFIAPAVDGQRGTIEVHLLVEKPPEYLRPHMTVSVDVLVGSEANALTIPRSALLDSQRANSVYVVVDGLLTKRPISLGLMGDALVSVNHGLTPQDWVATYPQPTWQLGDRVRVSKSQPKADEQN